METPYSKTLSKGTREDAVGFTSCSLWNTSYDDRTRAEGLKLHSLTDGNEAKNENIPGLMCEAASLSGDRRWESQPLQKPVIASNLECILLSM